MADEIASAPTSTRCCRCGTWSCSAHGHSALRRTAEVDQGHGNRHGSGQSILLVAQKSAAKDEPSAEDLYKIGCISNILQISSSPTAP